MNRKYLLITYKYTAAPLIAKSSNRYGVDKNKLSAQMLNLFHNQHKEMCEKFGTKSSRMSSNRLKNKDSFGDYLKNDL